MKFWLSGLAIMAMTIGLLATVLSANAFGPAPANGKCTSWQSRCAVAAGGMCDPATGKWSVSARLMTGYLQCIDAGQAKKGK
jgi:hypothetical protein